MQLTDLQVLSDIQNWLDKSCSFWLCTIISTYGSAPRSIGSLFAWNGQRRLGSISGGCLEDAFIEELNSENIPKTPCLFSYDKHLVNEHVTIELPCGGSIQLLVEHFNGQDRNKTQHLRQWYQDALLYLPFSRHVHLKSGEITQNLPPRSAAAPAIEKTANQVHLFYRQVWRLLIFGIGQVSESVAKIGLMAGYDVKICDMREDLADSWHFTQKQGGVDVSWIAPDVFVDKYSNERTIILALSHDLRIDDLGLLAALESNAFYIGAMGSIRTTEKRRQRLERIGEFSPDQLAKLHAPVGLPIGSKTPMEIAIAIFADIIAKQNGIALSAKP